MSAYEHLKSHVSFIEPSYLFLLKGMKNSESQLPGVAGLISLIPMFDPISHRGAGSVHRSPSDQYHLRLPGRRPWPMKSLKRRWPKGIPQFLSFQKNIPVRFSSSSIHARTAEILWPGVLIDDRLRSSVQASSGATVLPERPKTKTTVLVWPYRAGVGWAGFKFGPCARKPAG